MAPRCSGAIAVDAGHVPVVRGVPLLVEDPGQEGHHLGGQKERIRRPLMAERGLVLASTAGAAERPAAVRRMHRDVVRQAAQTDLQRAKRLEREVDREVRAEEVSPCDCADHHGTARKEGARAVSLHQQVALVVGRVAWSVERLKRQPAYRELLPRVNLADRGACLRLQLTPAGYEVVVEVGIERVCEPVSYTPLTL